MERFLKFCADLDELGYFNEADTVFLKYAAKHNDLLKETNLDTYQSQRNSSQSL